MDDFRAQAERIVLRSNGMDGLSTCVLRVGIPFGPGDGVFVPFLVRCAKLGLAKVWIFDFFDEILLIFLVYVVMV